MKILLCVCGSIAAYKAAVLTRLLVKQGASVQVLMTHSANDFVGALTFSTLSKKPVMTRFFDPADEGQVWNSHVELGLWADLMIVAPATAHTLAKMAQGLCDNLLTATYLSARCPVWVAPAMDLDMWQHPATRRNIALLQEAGNRIIPVESGELASGLVGDGRMAEPETIAQLVADFFATITKTNTAEQTTTTSASSSPTTETITTEDVFMSIHLPPIKKFFEDYQKPPSWSLAATEATIITTTNTATEGLGATDASINQENDVPTQGGVKGLRVLINAGPTYEPIDPVRFLGNRSSGKMGIALAEAAARQGAKVTLVLGPSHLEPQNSSVELLRVETAQDMLNAMLPRFGDADITICAAAIADYAPAHPSDTKIKKKETEMTLVLRKNPDILAQLGEIKQAHQTLVGFALETDNEADNAQKKLHNKNLDLIVLNSLRTQGAGFQHDTNHVLVFDKKGNFYDIPLASKTEVAERILQIISTSRQVEENLS